MPGFFAFRECHALLLDAYPRSEEIFYISL
jgi:hypothetical protein